MDNDDKELKDQRVVTMMTPSELETIDDWMFKNRIRSRGEAIRRLCQVGLEADKQFPALVDSYLATVRTAMDIAAHATTDAEEISILTQASDFGQRFGELRGAILSMRHNETVEQAFSEWAEIKEAYAVQGPDRALALMRDYLSRSRTAAKD